MGVSHLSPTGTRRQFQKIVDFKGNHIDLVDLESHDQELKEDSVVNRFTRAYNFREVDEWIGRNEKVIAETKHGVELRTLYHPSGTSQYFFLVVVTGEFHQENLALQHLDTYYEELKETLGNVYGKVFRKSSAWTSEEIEVNA